MKRTLAFLSIMLLIVAFAVGGEWLTGSVDWSGSSSSSGIILAVETTSSSFPVARQMDDLEDSQSASDGWKYPETLSVWYNLYEEGVNSDSINARITVDFSNDSTYWVEYSIADTLISLTADTNASVLGYLQIEDMPRFKYGRLNVTNTVESGDTLTITAGYSLDFSNY